MTDFDDVVNAIMRATGVDRLRAETIATVNGHTRPVVGPEQAERDARVLEKAEQWEITKLFRSFGFRVRSLSQPRETMQSEGFADLWVTHRARGLAFWWESKRQVGGEYSEAQLEFRADCDAGGVTYRGGDRYAAVEWLVELGIVRRSEHGVLEPVREERHERQESHVAR